MNVPVHTQYNKTIYSTLLGSGLLILTLVLNQFFHITLGDSLVSAINTFGMALITLMVPNADAPPVLPAQGS